MRAITLGNEPQEWRGLRMFLDQQVPADAPALIRMYNNFQGNLRDIVAAARDSGAPVLISTVGVNLKDSAPFASLHRAALTPKELEAWEGKFREGKALEEAGKPGEALDRYLSAAAIDDRYAELQFRLGRVYSALANFTEAKRCFALARDLDALRFRADGRINEIIRSVAGAAGPGVEFVDGEGVLAEGSPHGIPGRELFYEHVHMNPHGNYLLARALFPRVVALSAGGGAAFGCDDGASLGGGGQSAAGAHHSRSAPSGAHRNGVAGPSRHSPTVSTMTQRCKRCGMKRKERTSRRRPPRRTALRSTRHPRTAGCTSTTVSRLSHAIRPRPQSSFAARLSSCPATTRSARSWRTRSSKWENTRRPSPSATSSSARCLTTHRHT